MNEMPVPKDTPLSETTREFLSPSGFLFRFERTADRRSVRSRWRWSEEAMGWVPAPDSFAELQALAQASMANARELYPEFFERERNESDQH